MQQSKKTVCTKSLLICRVQFAILPDHNANTRHYHDKNRSISAWIIQIRTVLVPSDSIKLKTSGLSKWANQTVEYILES